MLYRLALIATIVFTTGCDTSVLPEDATQTFNSVRSADVLYRVAPLGVGQSLKAVAESPLGSPTLRTDRFASGYQLSLDLGGLRPDLVEIRYLANGVEVADPVRVSADDPIVAGNPDEEPDSWHYVWRDGQWILIKDYDKDPGTGGDSGTGNALPVPFTTPSGEVIGVTDVAFHLIGLHAPPPTEVRFETPVAFEITSRQTSGDGPFAIGTLSAHE